MPNDIPAGFVPDVPQSLPPGFVPDKTENSATIGAGMPKNVGNDFEGTGKYRGDSLGRYLNEATNLTAQGAKEHPIQNAIGRVVRGWRGDPSATGGVARTGFGNILGTMSALFMGPEGAAPASGMHETPLPAPLTMKQLPAARSIQAPVSSLDPPLSMREKLGGTLPTEPNARITAPIPPAAMPASTPAAGAPTLAPRVSGVTAGIDEAGRPINVLPRNVRPISKAQLGKNIETGVMEAAGTPTLRPGVSLRNQSLGAKVVTDNPYAEIHGPRLPAPSRMATEGEVARQVSPGGHPLEPNVPLRVQKPSELRPSGATLPGRSTGGSEYLEQYADNPNHTPEENKLVGANRQFIRANGEEMHKAVMGKPDLAKDIHDLEGQQIQHVLRNADPSMEDRVVTGAKYGEFGSSEKYGGTGHGKGISREDALTYLLTDRGMTADEILKEAQQVPRIRPVKERTAFDWRDVGKAPPARRDFPPLRQSSGPALTNPLKPKGSGL